MKIESGKWGEFKEWAAHLSAMHADADALFFRGQGDSRWNLDTTLERNGETCMQIAAYYRLVVGKIAPIVQTLTEQPVPEYTSSLARAMRDQATLTVPNRYPSGDDYKYLLYLRHHGFPSPLLDWSRSAYVAAFFAFRNEGPVDGARSIYAFCQPSWQIKPAVAGERNVRWLGSYVRSHARHFHQQSCYTVCDKFNDEGFWQFDSHQSALDEKNRAGHLVWRFDILSSERLHILRDLDEYNLNAFSLFNTTDAMFETLWLREHIFRGERPRREQNQADQRPDLTFL